MLGLSSHCRKEMGMMVGVGNASDFFTKNALDRLSARSLCWPAMCSVVILKWRHASINKRPRNICIMVCKDAPFQCTAKAFHHARSALNSADVMVSLFAYT